MSTGGPTETLLCIVASIIWSKREKPIPVTTEKAVRKTILQTVSATGKVQPETEVKISPEVAGEIIDLPVEDGKAINKGDLLVRVKPDSYKALLEQQEAAISSAKVRRTSSCSARPSIGPTPVPNRMTDGSHGTSRRAAAIGHDPAEQAAALEAAGKEGIIYNSTYTNFWEGAMAWSGWWHNQIGLLTEVASMVRRAGFEPGKVGFNDWVEAVHPMHTGFHARKSALARRYRYVIGTDEACASPFRRAVHRLRVRPARGGGRH